MSGIILPDYPDTRLGADSFQRSCLLAVSASARLLSGLPLMPSASLSSSSAVSTGASSPPGPKDPADGRTLCLQLPLGEPGFGNPTLRPRFSSYQSAPQLLSAHT